MHKPCAISDTVHRVITHTNKYTHTHTHTEVGYIGTKFISKEVGIIGGNEGGEQEKEREKREKEKRFF